VTARLKLGMQAMAVSLVLALLALLIWRLAAGGAHNLKAKESVPGFSLPRLDSPGHLSLASLRGRAVVLNFWASWCDPCKQEASLLEKAWGRWRSRDVVFVGIDQEDLKSDARHFLDRYGVTYPNVYDGQGKLEDPYGLTGRPETYFVGRSGDLTDHVIGRLASSKQIDTAIEKALSS
jgi:cytochrome c biogenesis protein CcmG/thiol:disulfide interchange protein DsbE